MPNIKINREDLLTKLDSVMPGLSPKEIVEQSSCFVFKDKRVMTYNDEIACWCELDVGFEGAVAAGPLVAILRKMPEESVKLDATTDGELIVIGKRRMAGIHREKEVLLPIQNVELPKKWKRLNDDFTEAVDIVQSCAAQDETAFALTCVHIHNDYIEACDNFQLSRYKLQTGITKPTLVRAESIKHIISFGMMEFSETENWLHFKNSDGLVISCRRYMEEFQDMSALLKVKGAKAALPKGMGEACERAEVFSAENADDNLVQIELRADKLRIKGQGVSGHYSEVKAVKYGGPPVVFTIKPKLLAALTERHNECVISPERLKVNAGKFSYVVCLGIVETKEG